MLVAFMTSPGAAPRVIGRAAGHDDRRQRTTLAQRDDITGRGDAAEHARNCYHDAAECVLQTCSMLLLLLHAVPHVMHHRARQPPGDGRRVRLGGIWLGELVRSGTMSDAPSGQLHGIW